MEKLISIIVPIYNNSKYLRECLDSVMNQSYKNIEILLIDDGSTDECAEICSFYQELDSRITYVYQDNRGVLAARKKGLMLARGDYVAFVDSDDWIASDMYETMIDFVEKDNSDLVECGICRVTENSINLEYGGIPKGNYIIDNYIIDNMIEFENSNRYGIRYSNCNKLFKRNLLLEIFEKVDDGIGHLEDALVTWLYILNAYKISIIDGCYYYYRANRDSATHNPSESYFVSVSKVFYILRKELYFIQHSKVLENKIDRALVLSFLHGLNRRQLFYQTNLTYNYILPYIDYKDKNDILVYGAGAVGKSYYGRLRDTYKDKTIILMDKYKKGENILSLEEGLSCHYDIILIAALKEELANNMREELMARDVDEKKIVWIKPTDLFSEIYCGE